MKKLFLLSLFVCIGILQCLADDFSYTDDNGVTWGCYVTSEDNKTVTINYTLNSGDVVVIPEKVYKGTSDEYTVTALGFSFRDNKTLESVTLPKTVTVLNGSLFSGCSSLREVLNTSQLEGIGSDVFRGCSSLTKVDLSSCTYIGDYAFYICSNLVSVGNLKNCTTIESDAFNGCI